MRKKSKYALAKPENLTELLYSELISEDGSVADVEGFGSYADILRLEELRTPEKPAAGRIKNSRKASSRI